MLHSIHDQIDCRPFISFAALRNETRQLYIAYFCTLFLSLLPRVASKVFVSNIIKSMESNLMLVIIAPTKYMLFFIVIFYQNDN